MGVCNETIKKRNEIYNNSFEKSEKSNLSKGNLDKKIISKYINILYKKILII